MSRVVFSVRFTIQGIIQNATSSVWFRIQRILKKCPGYYSAYDSVFSVLLKNVQGIIQHLVQDTAYYSKMSRVLFSVWFSIQGIIKKYDQKLWFRSQRIIKKCPGYYSAAGSGFRVFLKNVEGIIQSLIQDSAYYSQMSRVLFRV